MKKIIAILMTLAMLLSFAACAAKDTSDKATIEKAGKIIIGITDYAPMDYKDDNGEWTGFDAEFARLFAKELGVKCEFFVLPDWDTKFMELETKQIDAVWNGMTITEEALSNSSVSKAYVVNAQVVVMNKDRLGQFTTPESLAGLTVAVENGSAGQDCAEEIEGIKIVPLQNQASALMDVASGASDACIIDISMANAMTGAGTSYANLSYSLRLSEEEYGVSFRKGSDLTDAFNKFMDKLIADGTLKALADKYELTLAK